MGIWRLAKGEKQQCISGIINNLVVVNPNQAWRSSKPMAPLCLPIIIKTQLVNTNLQQCKTWIELDRPMKASAKCH